jgi:hypothetical protein
MHVIFRDVGQLEVHDLRQLINIETASGDIGGDQHGNFALFKVIQGTGARSLAFIAMNGRGRQTVFDQLFS